MALVKRVGNDVLPVGPQPQIVGDEFERRCRAAHCPAQGAGLTLLSPHHEGANDLESRQVS